MEIHVPSIKIHVPSIKIHAPSMEIHVPSIKIHAPSMKIHVPSMEIHVPSIKEAVSKVSVLRHCEQSEAIRTVERRKVESQKWKGKKSVIARSIATKQSGKSVNMDCFSPAVFAMTLLSTL
jgi:hypothetical protein